MALTDLELLARIKNGDEEAFESIFRTYYKSLCLFANKIVNDADIAEEIVQDIFYYLWDKREKTEFTTSVKSYLFRAVHNNSLKHIRHQKIVKNYEGMVITAGESYSLQENYTEMGEISHIIKLTLDQASERTREIFELNRNEGLRYQEIADKLNISVKTVEAHMTSILKLFRENLGDYLSLLIFMNFLIG